MLIHGILVSIWLIGVLTILYHVLLCTTSTTQNLNPKTTTQSQSQNLLDFAFPPNPNPPTPRMPRPGLHSLHGLGLPLHQCGGRVVALLAALRGGRVLSTPAGAGEGG